MYCFQVQIVVLLYGLCYVHGFLNFLHQNYLLKHSTPYNGSIFGNEERSWFEQPVDHFNKSDKRTWKMKFYKAIDSWQPGGPILLYINGESDLSYFGINDLTNQIVQETGAAFFALEHRYYGQSQPLSEQTTQNLVYLTSRQALADIAHFLERLKGSKVFKNSKVIVVGGSYAGNLAAWMKLMYPNMVDAVLSSSAPVFAKKDFYEYLETVTDTFTTYGSQDCVTEITKIFNSIHELLKTPEGIEQLKEKMGICKDVDMTIPENQQLFFFVKTSLYAIIAQYGSPKVVKDSCRTTTSDIDLIENLFPLVWNEEFGCISCDFIKYIKSIEGNTRSWIYQTCTELGYFQSTSSAKQMFGDSLPVDFYYKTCVLLFGEEFNEQRVEQGVMNTNNMYGGLTPNVENVIFTNGDLDPWHRLGIIQDLLANAPALYIMGASHCNDLDIAEPYDSESLREARKKIKNLVKQWIGDA